MGSGVPPRVWVLLLPACSTTKAPGGAPLRCSEPNCPGTTEPLKAMPGAGASPEQAAP